MRATYLSAIISASLIAGSMGARVKPKVSDLKAKFPSEVQDEEAVILAEVNATESLDESDEAGAPRCCRKDCCKGRPQKRNKCIQQLGICQRQGPRHPNRVGPRPSVPNIAPRCCHRNCCKGKPQKRNKCIQQLGICHRQGPRHPNRVGPRPIVPNIFKKKEVCCMCKKVSWSGWFIFKKKKETWFPGEDYNVGQRAFARCNAECAGSCRGKGATMAGCWKEQRMKQLRREARKNPAWTIQGMPDDWFGDSARDIC